MSFTTVMLFKCDFYHFLNIVSLDSLQWMYTYCSSSCSSLNSAVLSSSITHFCTYLRVHKTNWKTCLVYFINGECVSYIQCWLKTVLSYRRIITYRITYRNSPGRRSGDFYVQIWYTSFFSYLLCACSGKGRFVVIFKVAVYQEFI